MNAHYSRSLLSSLVLSISIAGCSSNSDSNSGEVASDTSSSGPLYLVKATDWSTNDGVAMHFVTDSLDENTTFDPSTALAISGYLGVALPEGDNPDRAFFVGENPNKVFRRYVVNDDGSFTLDAEMDMSNIGLGGSGRNLMRAGKILSATKGYFVDASTLQVVAYNPTTMEVDEIISLVDLDEAELPNRWSIFPTVDGDNFIAAISFYDEDWNPAQLTKLVSIDSANNNALSTDSSTQCGSVSASAKDAAGNIYFATHDDIALAYEQQGAPFPPCVIRTLAGSNEWDDGYVMNMQNLTNDNRLAMTVMTGVGDTGYTLVLSEAEQDALTNETSARSLIRDIWEFHSLDLTDDDAVATKIENVNATISRVTYGELEHDTLGSITWNSQTDANAAETVIYNTTSPTDWSEITTIPGQVELVGRIQ